MKSKFDGDVFSLLILMICTNDCVIKSGTRLHTYMSEGKFSLPLPLCLIRGFKVVECIYCNRSMSFYNISKFKGVDLLETLQIGYTRQGIYNYIVCFGSILFV